MVDVLVSVWGVAVLVILVGSGVLSARISGPGRGFVLIGGVVFSGAIVVAVWLGVSVEQAPIAALPAQKQAPAVAAADLETQQRALAFLVGAERQLNMGETEGARASYQAARSMFADVGDVQGQAVAAFGLGRLEHFTGQSGDARRWYAEAIEIYKRGGTALDRARVLAAYGDLEKDTFNWPEARGFYNRARQEWALAPEPKYDPHVLLGLESIALTPNGEARAREELEQADKIYDNIGDMQGRGDIAMLVGLLEDKLDRFGGARARFAEARIFYSAAGALVSEARANLFLARSEIQRGFNIEAQEALGHAARLYSEAESEPPPHLPFAWGDLERLQGRLPEARAHFSEAMERLHTAGDPDEAEAWIAIGALESALGNQAEADRGFEVAIKMFESLSSEEGTARATLAYADHALATDRLPLARVNFTWAWALFAAENDGLGEARALLGLGILDAREQVFVEARENLTQVRIQFQAAGSPFGEAIAAAALGDLELEAGNAAAATRAYQRASRTLIQMEGPVAEANRFLGLPPVQRIETQIGQDEDYGPAGGEVPAEQDGPSIEEIIAENIAAYPNHNSEARALVAKLEARLAAGLR